MEEHTPQAQLSNSPLYMFRPYGTVHAGITLGVFAWAGLAWLFM